MTRSNLTRDIHWSDVWTERSDTETCCIRHPRNRHPSEIRNQGAEEESSRGRCRSLSESLKLVSPDWPIPLCFRLPVLKFCQCLFWTRQMTRQGPASSSLSSKADREALGRVQYMACSHGTAQRR